MALSILVYGAHGWIGGILSTYLSRCGYNVVKSYLRADNEIDVNNEIDRIKPDRLICVVGRTHGENTPNIDYLEQSGKLVENIRDNLYAPFILATAAKKYNIHLTYFGTGCIFDGPLNFKESDKPNFFGSSYSVVKGFTDRIMHQFDDVVLNLRIRMPISYIANERNFINKIVKFSKITSIPNSMTVIEDMLPAIDDMIKTKYVGTINLVNPGVITHNEILLLYKLHIDKDLKWTNVLQEELNVGKRTNNFLDTTLIHKKYPEIPNIYQSVSSIIKKWNAKINVKE